MFLSDIPHEFHTELTVGVDVSSTLSEELFIDSVEWLCFNLIAIQSGTTDYSAPAVLLNYRGVFLTKVFQTEKYAHTYLGKGHCASAPGARYF